LCIFAYNDCLQIAISTLQNALLSIDNWCKQAGLLINFEKTKFMVFHRHNTYVDNEIELNCNNIKIERVDDFKYLGITFDSTLTFNQHFKNVENKYSSAIGALHYVKRIIPFQTFVLLLNSYVLPISDYGLPIWGPTKKLCLKNLQSKINIILVIHIYPSFAKFYTKEYWRKFKNAPENVKKTLTNACKKAHNSVNFWKIIERANLLTVTERLDYNSIMFFKTIDVIGSKCKELQTFFIHSGELSNTDRITRNDRNMMVIEHLHELFKNSIKYYISIIWNNLSFELKQNVYSINRFSKLFNTHIITNRNDKFIG